jgi:hypothetical protein
MVAVGAESGVSADGHALFPDTAGATLMTTLC